jgi:hypothetical protein
MAEHASIRHTYYETERESSLHSASVTEEESAAPRASANLTGRPAIVIAGIGAF